MMRIVIETINVGSGFCVQRERSMGDVLVDEVVISEFLYDPVDSLSDSKAEWIELQEYG